MLKELKISDIKVGKRHRKDMGDLKSLANSIRQDGFLQPIGVTEKLELVFGERRLRAHKDILKKRTILARIVDVKSIITGEYAENEIRKDFTPSERVAIAKTIEKQIGNRHGQRTDNPLVQKFAQVPPGKKTRDIAAGKSGFGNHETYRQAAKVVQNGTVRLIHAMDSGKVSISAASILADADPDELETILELDERAILRAANEIRQRKTAQRIEAQQAIERRAQTSVKPNWTITGDQKVVRCNLLLADPPYGITDEPWEPDNIEQFTREWCLRWAKCGAEFLAIFWSQDYLFEGRKWFDESLIGYKFQQILVWHGRNTVKKKNRSTFRPSWEPIFLYRRNDCRRPVASATSDWGDDFHDLDCHVSAVPQSNYNGHGLKQHPCQKPVGVMLWLINALTETGELVASPFCGVAPCGIAATQLGRKYHGIDTDAKYRKIADRRIASYGQSKR